MRSFVVGAAALTAAGLSGASVRAGDLPYPPPPAYNPPPAYTVSQPLNVFSWAGPYLGGNLGYEWGKVSNNPTKPSGFEGGVQGGFNWQSGCWVFGIEGDLQVTGADDTFAPWKFSNPWFGTVRGRAGYTINNVLLYGTAGLAFGELRAETFGLSESQTTAGWALGFGTEVGLSDRWSAKIEYLHIDLSESHFILTGVTNGFSANVVRAGVNYHF